VVKKDANVVEYNVIRYEVENTAVTTKIIEIKGHR